MTLVESRQFGKMFRSKPTKCGQMKGKMKMENRSFNLGEIARAIHQVSHPPQSLRVAGDPAWFTRIIGDIAWQHLKIVDIDEERVDEYSTEEIRHALADAYRLGRSSAPSNSVGSGGGK